MQGRILGENRLMYQQCQSLFKYDLQTWRLVILSEIFPYFCQFSQACMYQDCVSNQATTASYFILSN
jgi:hypothetical protein